MPTLSLKIAPPCAPDRIQALARALTAITVQTLGKRAAVTAVVIDESNSHHWTVGARPLQRPTALLEISITAGTNTAAQKSAFIAAAFAELQQQLAPDSTLEEASYVIVRELPASDWGYGGQTQQARQQQRATAEAAVQNR